MAAMARLLAAESVSQTIAEDVGHQKLAAQYIHRELREADEANFLDEEDMLVFDSKPMTDPLNLVCCNACKKPLKASQYAAHAELCKSLSFAEEIVLEHDGGIGHKKPPRKERKKLLTAYANQVILVGERERFETVGGHDTAALSSHLHEQMQLIYSFPTEAKADSLCVDGPLRMDGSGISTGYADNLAGAMPPPTKRSKLIAAESLLISDHLETANGVNKSLCISTQEAFTCGEYPNGSSAGSGKTCDHVVRYQMPKKVHDCYLLTREFPAPFATKIYYSQKSHRLRSAISNLYKASTNEHCSELLASKGVKGLQENALLSRTTSSRNIFHEEFDYHLEKRETRLLPSVQTPNQTLAQSSEVCLDKSGGCPSFPLNNVLGPHRPPVGMLRTNYLSNPYSFTGNSEKPLVTMQLPKGSVPVI